MTEKDVCSDDLDQPESSGSPLHSDDVRTAEADPGASDPGHLMASDPGEETAEASAPTATPTEAAEETAPSAETEPEPQTKVRLDQPEGGFLIDFSNTPYMESSQTGTAPRRLNWRAEMLLRRNEHALKGMRVLDLAAHDGRFSYGELLMGASFVRAVEGRQHLVDNGIANLEAMGVDPDRYEFMQGDVFEHLAGVQPGEFDTICCFGFLYHTAKHIEFFEHIARIQPKYVILDTEVDRPVPNAISKFRQCESLESVDKILQEECGESLIKFLDFVFGRSYMWVGTENPEKESNAFDPSGLVAVSSNTCLRLMLDVTGYKWEQINWHKAGIWKWDSLENYRDSTRVSYVATRPD